MFDSPFGLIKISGNGVRPSIFGSSLQDGRAFNLGQTAYEWYTRAKAAVERFEGLKARAEGLPIKTERDAILAWIGSSGDENSPMYRYIAVKEDVTTAASDENMDMYTVERRQNRILKLEAFNGQLETKVRSSEMTAGITPAPGGTTTVPARTTTTTKSFLSQYGLPIAIGGGAIILAIVVAVVAKGKK